jgi:GT2 family glycosyltransferase
MVRTSIIILSFNTKDLLHSCLEALFRYIPAKELEVIVVDNASSDGSTEMVKKKFPGVSLVMHDKNLGFAAGINAGVKKARGTFLLFLNSDALLQDTSLLQMIGWAEAHPEAGVIGGQMMNADGTPQRSSGSFYNLFSVARMLLAGDAGEMLGQKYSEPHAVDWVSGGFMLIRKEIFDTINGFDDNFFMYIEDMELCYRVRKAGFGVYVFPQSAVIHEGHGSSNRTFAVVHIYRGLRLFYKKHHAGWEYAILNGLLTMKAVGLIGIGMLTGNTYLKDTYRKALAKK